MERRGSQAPALMACFERLGSALFDRGRLTSGLIRPVAGTRAYWADTLDAANPSMFPGLAISALQCAAHSLLRDHGAYAVVVPPGARLRAHPMAPFLKPVGAAGEEARAAAVSVLTVHGDGRSPYTSRIRAVNGDTSRFLRSATIVFCRVWNEPAWLFRGNEARLGELTQALDTLATNGRPEGLRDLVLAIAPIGSLATLSEQLYGAAWDLLDLVTIRSRPDVAPGIWNDCSASAQRLREQARLVSEIALVMLATSASRSARVALAVDAWIGTVEDVQQRAELERVGRMVTTALMEWQQAATIASVDLLFEAGVLQSPTRRAQALAALQQRQGPQLPGLVARRCASRLLEVGCWGHADALFGAVPCSPLDGLPPHRIARRLQGLRVCGGYSIAAAARRLEISSYKARRVLKECSPPAVAVEDVVGEIMDRGVLPFDADSRRAAVESIRRWVRDEIGGLSVFDDVECLCPEPCEA